MADMHDQYKEELKVRIDAWDGMKTEDFQYDPERSQLKAAMREWLAANSEETDDKKLTMDNRKYFARCMAELVYEEKVKPNLNAFLLR